MFHLNMLKKGFWVLIAIVSVFCINGCKDGTMDDDIIIPPDDFDINSITDTYYDLASADQAYDWGPYNVHDPSIIKVNETYYCYNTDVAFGTAIRPGIQIRRSKDLIEWDFVGWVFDDIPAKGREYIESKGATPNNSLWAPYVMKVGDEFRLYYSLASNVGRVSCIGLATSTSPIGSWVEQDVVVTSANDGTTHTNAIDPTVLVDQSGEHWMYYGSSWDAIYSLKLDAASGLAENPGDRGERIAHRGFTGNTINGNIEGPEIIYNEEFGQYYLFIAYDWLETKYNVRVGRSDSPEGPFYDINGVDMNVKSDNSPMILAPYRFDGHSGWQGVSHPAVFSDGEGQFYIAHQGRPGVNKYFMVLHVRKILWTEDGWPVVSPERYAAVDQTPVSEEELVGNYDQIVFGYQVVPGFADTQTSPDFQDSVPMELNADGSINGDAGQSWSYDPPWLTLNWNGGWTDILHVERGRDWEKKVTSTILFTGLNNAGTAIWAKKVD